MRIGVALPHQAVGTDPVAVRDWAQAAEELGFDDLALTEHVIGPDPDRHPDQTFLYTNRTVWHEPLVLCGFLAAATRRIGLQTAVVVLPLRETVILAKQAAEVDVLSGGRLRLGVGVGWMAFEFPALGQEFHARGARFEEQIALLRALWTEPSVTFRGRWHAIEAAGINPLPVQRPIPLRIGGTRPAARRAARHGDGWIVPGDHVRRPPDDETRRLLAWLHEEARAAGRPPEELGVQVLFSIASAPEKEWAVRAAAWRDFGATDLLVTFGDPALATVGQHIEALRRVKRALEPVQSA
jgi:probable F420-dependent oxidoreductase